MNLLGKTGVYQKNQKRTKGKGKAERESPWFEYGTDAAKILLQGDYFVIVDLRWACMLSTITWNLSTSSCRGYVKCDNPKYKNKRTSTYMHRLIMDVKKNEYVDHINGDTMDNRECNLRICTLEQNQANQMKRKNKTKSIYKGVSINRIGKYIAYIGFKNKYIHLGCFNDEKEAALAYNEAAKKYFGDFARINIL